jgi:hypothetical protein
MPKQFITEKLEAENLASLRREPFCPKEGQDQPLRASVARSPVVYHREPEKG